MDNVGIESSASSTGSAFLWVLMFACRNITVEIIKGLCCNLQDSTEWNFAAGSVMFTL